MITNENIHIWKNTQQTYMVSNENNKELYSFTNKDDAINALYALGFKTSARALWHNKTI